ncbi:MAG: cytochrome c3 family protein [Desulfuromonadaceae bacterium]|nr:cytochrome c3 family protein [Desulfuromonadaceae bacterium]
MNRALLFILAGLISVIASTATAMELKNIVYNTKNAGTVVFSHAQHLAKKSPRGTQAFSCATCHAENKSKKHYTMTDMYKGYSCGSCHNGRHAFDVHECGMCHQVKEIVFQVKETGPTPFSHKKHLTKLKDCSVCHSTLYTTGKNPSVTMAEMQKGKSCGFCHNGKRAFDVNKCSNCHKNPELVYSTPPVANAIFSHALHTQAYSCKDCHVAMFKPDRSKNKRVTMAQMAKGQSCGACHDGQAAFSVKGDCAKCHVGLKIPGKLTFKNKTGTVIGHFSHVFHTAVYQCSDCHTTLYPYGNGKRTTMKQMETGASCGACHDGKTAFSATGDCLKCHKNT